MTQAMQFSAFKGPFANRIDVWNGKLYMVGLRAGRGSGFCISRL